MYQASEIVQLILVACITPMVVSGIRATTLRHKGWLVVSYVAMICAYVLTVAEGYVLPELMNILEHCAYALSGVALAAAMYLLSRDARGRATQA